MEEGKHSSFAADYRFEVVVPTSGSFFVIRTACLKSRG
jgi:hypothetical protein